MKDEYGTQTLESMGQALWYNKWMQRKFNEYLTGKILEIGCGLGNFTGALIEFGQVTAIDINYEYIKKLNIKLKGKAQVGYGNIESGKYFFNSDKFNSIICLNVLEHIRNDGKALKNMYKLLEKNGYLILLVPAHKLLYGEIDKAIGHFRRYEKKEIGKIVEQYKFEVIKIQKLNFLGALGWLFNAKILKRKGIDNSSIKLFNFIAPAILPIENFFEPFFGTSVLVIAKKR